MKKTIIIPILIIFLLVDTISASNISLIENQTWQQNLKGLYSANGAVFGDIDNDGDLDMISIGCTSSLCQNTDENNSFVWINNGTSFIKGITWEQNFNISTFPYSIALGDINNDGYLDLVFSGAYTEIYINNGTSFIGNTNWSSGVKLPDPFGAASASVALGDLDNDGDLDLIFPDMGDRAIWINNGTSFVNNTEWGWEIEDNSKISTGLIDVDNDGDLDLNVVGDSSANTYLNNGTRFIKNITWSTSVADEASVAWGDIDNDGDLDTVVSGFATPFFSMNNGSGFLDDPSWNSGFGSYAWGFSMFGDYDNDGDLDLILAGSDKVTITNNNESTFAEDEIPQLNITEGSRETSLLWGDVDNDGDLDLTVIGGAKVYINNITITNKLPTPPISLSSSYNNRVIKLGWQNGSDNETVSTGLYYNLMVGDSTNNHSIISGVYGGSGDASRGGTAFGYFGNMMQRKNFSLKVDRLSPSTTYYWYVQTIDTGLKAGNWSERQSFTTPSDMLAPNVTINSPVDRFNSSSYIITFNATVWDNINVSNVSLWGSWNGGLHLNFTNSTGKNNTDYLFTINLAGNPDGTYQWMIGATDNATNSVNATTRTLILDTTSPNITITFPSNNTNTSNSNLDVNFTVVDALTVASSCWYSNDSYTVNTTLSSCVNITEVIWSEGSHNVRIYVNDSAGNYNFTPVRFVIDTIKPNINITFPSNNTNWSVNTIDVNYTASDTNLQACWYSNDSYIVNNSLASCTTNITSIIWTEGIHNVTIWVNDSAGNVNYSRVSFTIDLTAPSFNSPRNFTHNINVSFAENFTVTDSRVELGTYVLNDTSKFNISQGGEIKNSTNLSSVAIYWLNLSVNDSLGNLNSIVFFINVTQDFEAPNVTLITPYHDSSYTSNSQSINFFYNVSDFSEILNCSLIINGKINITNNSINKSSNLLSFTQSFVPASYTWNVNCTDALSNIGNSSIRSFTVTAASSGGNTGGGGGGGTLTASYWTNTIVISNDNISLGVEKELGKGQRVKFNVSGESHYIGIINISLGTAIINITSNPIQLTLGIGQETRLDVSNDSYYDIYLKLISILNSKANLTIKSIHEPVFVNQTIEENETAVNEAEEIAKKNNVSLWIAIISALLIFWGILIYLWIR